MIRTSPGGDPVDPLELQMSYPRHKSDGPWVMANFVSTIDGAAVVDGGSTAINDADDKAMFAAIRAATEFIVVGAGTVRAEDYRPVVLDEDRQRVRVEAGMEPSPHLIIVSGSLSLDPEARVFGDPDHRVTILSHDTAPDDKVAELSEVADVVQLGAVTATEVVHYLRLARVVLVEGGPTLMGEFVRAGLIDEMALTVAPMLASGASPRIAHGVTPDSPLELKLDRVLYGDRSLFLRYLRD
ncbi:MAG TPA: dihydrofolate reductase family protein [Acidimicrobiia bacterium]|nr:dihydrofolate reductase family protein [Acidimicrobiia bacterium]